MGKTVWEILTQNRALIQDRMNMDNKVAVVETQLVAANSHTEAFRAERDLARVETLRLSGLLAISNADLRQAKNRMRLLDATILNMHKEINRLQAQVDGRDSHG